MIFQEIIPCAALRPFVDNFLLVSYGARESMNQIKPYPTRIEQALVFFAQGGINAYDVQTKQYTSIARNALFGQQISRLDFHPVVESHFLMLMVVFRPGALHRLLGLPSSELTHAFVDAESILASELRRVNDRVANASSHTEMVMHVEKYLLGKCNAIKIDHHPIDRIAQLLINDPLNFSLDWLASQANLSPRQFERKFSDRIGVSPKFYSRISRFSKAFHFKNANPQTDWLTIAVRYGYTDYYHLAKEFKQFANATPNILVNEYSRRVEAGAILGGLNL